MHSTTETTIQNRIYTANHLLYKIMIRLNSNVGAIEPFAANCINVHLHIPILIFFLVWMHYA